MVITWVFKLVVSMLHIGMVLVGGQMAEIHSKGSVAVKVETWDQDLFRQPNLFNKPG